MARNGRNKFWHSLLEHKWVLAIVAYILFSIAYQSLSPFSPYWRTNTYTFYEQNCYTFKIRIPEEVGVAPPLKNDFAQPLTIWGWRENPQAQCEEKVSVSWNSTSDLIWLNLDKKEISPSFELITSTQESFAPRKTILFYAPYQKDVADTILVTLELDGASTSWPIAIQPWWVSALWYSANLIFGITWITIITAFATAAKLYLDYSNHKRQRRDTILADAQAMESWGEEKLGDLVTEYLRLVKNAQSEFSSEPSLLISIQEKFEKQKKRFEDVRLWAQSLRQDIIVNITKPPAEFQHLIVEIIQPNTDFLSKNEQDALLYVNENLAAPQTKNIKMYLENALKTFCILGVPSAKTLVRTLKESNSLIWQGNTQKTLDTLQSVWYESGGSSGRYLLSELANTNQKVRDTINQWQKEPAPPHYLQPGYGLWSKNLIYEVHGGAESHLKGFSEDKPMWHTPFGPVKAENDPRLPRRLLHKLDNRPVANLFWNEHPAWKKAIAPEPACVVAEPGAGTSTLIWMGRHTRRLWGALPSFSLYLSLSGLPTRERLLQKLETALEQTLLRDIVEDPLWLLNASRQSQDRVINFLVEKRRGFNGLLEHLERAGLPQSEREVFASALFNKSLPGTKENIALDEFVANVNESMAESARYRLKDSHFQTFLWIESREVEQLSEWFELLQSIGLLDKSVIKLFCSRKPNLYKTADKLAWTSAQKRKMLNHRIKAVSNGLDIKMIAPGWAEAIEKNLMSAQNTPAQLIKSGNNIIATVAPEGKPS